MKIDFWFPNFGLQATKLEIITLEWFILQKIWKIRFWFQFSKCDDVIKRYDDVIKIFFLKFCSLIMNKYHTKFQVNCYLWWWYSHHDDIPFGPPPDIQSPKKPWRNKVKKLLEFDSFEKLWGKSMSNYLIKTLQDAGTVSRRSDVSFAKSVDACNMSGKVNEGASLTSWIWVCLKHLRIYKFLIRQVQCGFLDFLLSFHQIDKEG